MARATTVPRQSRGEGHGVGDMASTVSGVSDKKQAFTDACALAGLQVRISFRGTCTQQYRKLSDPKIENKRCCCARVLSCLGLAVLLFALSFGR